MKHAKKLRRKEHNINIVSPFMNSFQQRQYCYFIIISPTNILPRIFCHNMQLIHRSFDVWAVIFG